MTQWTYSPMEDTGGYLNPEDIDRLVSAASKVGRKQFRDKLLLTLLFRSGRRVGELVQLTPGDINWDRKMVHWHIEKRKDKDHKEWKPLDEFSIMLLKNYINNKEIDDEDPVFPITTARVWQIVRRAGEVSGIEKVGDKPLHPHHFRHSFAVWMAQNIETPEDLTLLQLLLAHTDIRTTMFYLQFSPRRAKKLLQRAFNG